MTEEIPQLVRRGTDCSSSWSQLQSEGMRLLVMSSYLGTLRNQDQYLGQGDSTEQGAAGGSLDLDKIERRI